MAPTPPQTQLEQSHADMMTRVGAWLFRRRTVIPVPLALAILLCRRVALELSRARGRGGRSRGAWRSDSPVGRAAHRRHLAHAQRPARSPRRVGTVRAGAQSFVCGQRRPVGRIRRERAPAMARTGLCRHPRIRVSRDRAVGRTAARGAARRAVPRLRRAGAALAATPQSWATSTHARFGARPRTLRPAVPGFSWRETFYSERGTLIAIAAGYRAPLAQAP